MVTAETIRQWLEAIKDPEIPTVSIVDMGIVREISFKNGHWYIELVPTFAGCPAMRLMQKQVEALLKEKNVPAEVVTAYHKPWQSSYMTAKGWEGIQKIGLAVPPPGATDVEKALQRVRCPKCNSQDTELITPFGPTACRAIHRCKNCLETFEQFKLV
ncbi:MAG: 1,2-phenylacetyl-CoA epoxidase subunit PaaD [Bacteroidia bacterium]